VFRGRHTKLAEVEGGSRGVRWLDGSDGERAGLRRAWELPLGTGPLTRTGTCESEVAQWVHLRRMGRANARPGCWEAVWRGGAFDRTYFSYRIPSSSNWHTLRGQVTWIILSSRHADADMTTLDSDSIAKQKTEPSSPTVTTVTPAEAESSRRRSGTATGWSEWRALGARGMDHPPATTHDQRPGPPMGGRLFRASSIAQKPLGSP